MRSEGYSSCLVCVCVCVLLVFCRHMHLDPKIKVRTDSPRHGENFYNPAWFLLKMQSSETTAPLASSNATYYTWATNCGNQRILCSVMMTLLFAILTKNASFKSNGTFAYLLREHIHNINMRMYITSASGHELCSGRVCTHAVLLCMQYYYACSIIMHAVLLCMQYYYACSIIMHAVLLCMQYYYACSIIMHAETECTYVDF